MGSKRSQANLLAMRLRSYLAAWRHLKSKIRLRLANLSPFSPLRVLPMDVKPSTTEITTVIHPILIPETIRTKTTRDPILCISTSFGQSSDPLIPTVELFPLVNKKVTVLVPTFAAGQFSAITHSYRSKPTLSISETLAIPAYLTSQCGHFIGDCLGQIVYYSRNPELRQNKPLLVTYPSESWLKLLLKLCPDGSLHPVNPSDLVTHNLHIPPGSVVLPRFSPLQNLTYASYYISSLLESTTLKESTKIPDKLFFTTLREDRITNISEVTEFLSDRGFTIVSPQRMKNVRSLLKILSKSKYLISEQGSIHQNVLISRNKPYLLLASESNCRQTRYEASCGGIYTSYHSHIIRTLPCTDTADERNLHPYSRPIYVNLHSLDKLLS